MRWRSRGKRVALVVKVRSWEEGKTSFLETSLTRSCLNCWVEGKSLGLTMNGNQFGGWATNYFRSLLRPVEGEASVVRQILCTVLFARLSEAF